MTDTGNAQGPKCIYNRSHLDPKELDCCFGEYNLIKNGESEKKSWGGNVKSCLGGMVRTSWNNEYLTSKNNKYFNDITGKNQGYPRPLLYTIPRDDEDTPIGMNTAHRIPSNIETTSTEFSTVANFYTPGTPAIEGLHEHTGYVSTKEVDVPYAVNPVDDLSGTPYTYKGRSVLFPGREAILFDCEDEAFELKHRIEVYIREWNTLTDFVTYKTSGGQTYNPDVNQLEGSCGYGGDFVNLLPCNDHVDFDDIAQDVGGYDTASSYPTQRRSYFPGVRYE